MQNRIEIGLFKRAYRPYFGYGMPRKTKRATQAAQVLHAFRQKISTQRSFQGELPHSLWRIVSVEGKIERTYKIGMN